MGVSSNYSQILIGFEICLTLKDISRILEVFEINL